MRLWGYWLVGPSATRTSHSAGGGHCHCEVLARASGRRPAPTVGPGGCATAALARAPESPMVISRAAGAGDAPQWAMPKGAHIRLDIELALGPARCLHDHDGRGLSWTLLKGGYSVAPTGTALARVEKRTRPIKTERNQAERRMCHWGLRILLDLCACVHTCAALLYRSRGQRLYACADWPVPWDLSRVSTLERHHRVRDQLERPRRKRSQRRPQRTQ